MTKQVVALSADELLVSVTGGAADLLETLLHKPAFLATPSTVPRGRNATVPPDEPNRAHTVAIAYVVAEAIERAAGGET